MFSQSPAVAWLQLPNNLVALLIKNSILRSGKGKRGVALRGEGRVSSNGPVFRAAQSPFSCFRSGRESPRLATIYSALFKCFLPMYWILQCEHKLVTLAHSIMPTEIAGPAHLAHTRDHKGSGPKKHAHCGNRLVLCLATHLRRCWSCK